MTAADWCSRQTTRTSKLRNTRDTKDMLSSSSLSTEANPGTISCGSAISLHSSLQQYRGTPLSAPTLDGYQRDAQQAAAAAGWKARSPELFALDDAQEGLPQPCPPCSPRQSHSFPLSTRGPRRATQGGRKTRRQDTNSWLWILDIGDTNSWMAILTAGCGYSPGCGY